MKPLSRQFFYFSFLLLIACGIPTRRIASVRYYTDRDSASTRSVVIPTEKILPFLKASKRHAAYFPKGGFGYLKINYKNGRYREFHILPDSNHPLQDLSSRSISVFGKFYEIGDTTISREFDRLLRDCMAHLGED